MAETKKKAAPAPAPAPKKAASSGRTPLPKVAAKAAIARDPWKAEVFKRDPALAVDTEMKLGRG